MVSPRVVPSPKQPLVGVHSTSVRGYLISIIYKPQSLGRSHPAVSSIPVNRQPCCEWESSSVNRHRRVVVAENSHAFAAAGFEKCNMCYRLPKLNHLHPALLACSMGGGVPVNQTKTIKFYVFYSRYDPIVRTGISLLRPSRAIQVGHDIDF